MQNAAYGVFKKGIIVFNEPVTAPDDSKVVVVFLDKQADAPVNDGKSLVKLFDTLGAWEDSKDADTIIAEIEKSRISRTAEFVL
jgi:hypothetical protein